MKQLKVFLLVLVSLTHLPGRAQQAEPIFQKIKEINNAYNQFYESNDTTILTLIADENFSLRDYTLDINLGSKADLRKYLSSFSKRQPSPIRNFKSEIKSIFFISPFVADVFGMNSGIHEGKAFSTPFSTVMMFDKNYKLEGWTDHVHPKTFSGGSPRSRANVRLLKEFYKGYEAIDTSYITKYCSKNMKLIDPTFQLNYTIDDMRRAWLDFFTRVKGLKITLSKTRIIAENVIDVNGYAEFTSLKGNKKLKTPFSTVFIIKDKKIVHWVDHFDKEAFSGM